MSFVGPRPERPYFVQELTRHIPFYANRHAVKPGITGWAQINYPYSASAEDAREKLQYDVYYAKDHSLFLDLIILVQTAQVILFGKGARLSPLACRPRVCRRVAASCYAATIPARVDVSR